MNAAGMTISTSTLNFSSYTEGGMFGYAGTPGPQGLFFAVSPLGGSDPYGNAYPAGLSVTQGNLLGMTIVGSSLDATSVIQGTTINQGNINQPGVTGGTATSTQLNINSAGGGLYSYTQSATTVTYSTAGTYQWTAPTGVTHIQAQCWAAGGGGDGGNTSFAGAGGGGGEYAAEPSLSVVPGQVYSITVGNAGQAGATGTGGSAGGNSTVGANLVTANGGGAGNNGNPGAGGSGSINTLEEPGGNGGDNFNQNSGGSGGGGAGDSGGPGGAGVDSVGSSGGAAGTAGGGGVGSAGTAGAASGASASNVSGVGGGGGGAGEGTSSNTVTNYYQCTFSCSYYGSQASGNSNQQRGNSNSGTGGTMYQGCSNGQLSTTGDQYSFALFPYTQMQSDLAGATINHVQLQLTNLHSWYDTGCYVIMGYAPFTTFAQTGNLSGSNPDAQQFWIDEGETVFQTVINGWGTVFQSGAACCLMFGRSADADGGGTSPTSLYNYGYFYGEGNPDSTPILAITFTVAGSGSVSGGNGGAGKVVLTYSAPANNALTASISPVATTDTLGNTIPTGVMVQGIGSITTSVVVGSMIVAQNPNNASTAPATPEVWHQMPTSGLASGWATGNGVFYRLLPHDTVQVFGSTLHTAGTFTANSSIIWTLPTAYWPSRSWNLAGPGIAGRCGAEVTSSGVLTALNPTNATVQECDISGEYPLHI